MKNEALVALESQFDADLGLYRGKVGGAGYHTTLAQGTVIHGTRDNFGLAWELLGDAAEYAKSQERLEIIKILREHGPKTPKEIAEAMSKKQCNIRALMWKMAKDQEIKTLDGKRYETLKR